MAGFPSYIFVNIQPCLKKTTGFLKCFFCFWLAFSNYFLYMEKPLPAYDRHLNWLFGMFFSFPVQNLFPFPAFQPTFPVIFTQDIFLFPDIPTGFFSDLFCFWLAFWLVFPHPTGLSGWKQAGIFLQIPATHCNL